MELLEEFNGGSRDPKDFNHLIIMKRKRTKRHRPQSPIPFSIVLSSPTGDRGGGYGSNGDHNNVSAAETTDSSPATSSDFVESATEEEEDMANCLILLAQGQSIDTSMSSLKPNDHDHETAGLRFTIRTFPDQAPLSGNGYQCKTCDRAFPSFQALGGHRASHKKHRLATAEEKRPVRLPSSDDEEEKFKSTQMSSSPSLQLSIRSSYGNAKTSSKIHDCSICGAEFASGQALGGHMRRHRVSVGFAATNTTLSLSPIGFDSDDQKSKKARNVLSLDLDLNLPAPEHDRLRESTHAFASNHQPPPPPSPSPPPQQKHSPLVLSAAPTLVDCHY